MTRFRSAFMTRRLRHAEGGSGGDATSPVGAHRAPRALVGRAVQPERCRPHRAVEPGHVDGARALSSRGVDERRAMQLPATAEQETRPRGAPEAARRREADVCPPRVRAARIDVQPDEADERACAREARGERLLPVADAVRVDVARLQDRQVAAAQMRECEPGEARPVALVPARADVDGEPRPARYPRDDLAPVGDVQLHRSCAARPVRDAEGEVVDAGVGQPARAEPCRSPHEHQRMEVPADSGVRRPVGGAEQLVSPDVLVRGEGVVDPGRSRRHRAWAARSSGPPLPAPTLTAAAVSGQRDERGQRHQPQRDPSRGVTARAARTARLLDPTLPVVARHRCGSSSKSSRDSKQNGRLARPARANAPIFPPGDPASFPPHRA